MDLEEYDDKRLYRHIICKTPIWIEEGADQSGSHR